jgi:hypothetical protein
VLHVDRIRKVSYDWGVVTLMTYRVVSFVTTDAATCSAGQRKGLLDKTYHLDTAWCNFASTVTPLVDHLSFRVEPFRLCTSCTGSSDHT